MVPLALVYLECIKSDVLVLCNGKNSKIYVLPGIDSSKKQPELIPLLGDKWLEITVSHNED